MKIMCDLLAQGRPPSELIGVYASEDAARGRNAPCTCGRSRKWKQCHGDARANARPSRPQPAGPP